MEAGCLNPTWLPYVVEQTKGENTEVLIMTRLHGTMATGATNRKKPFAGVSNPSKGSGATVGYLYLGIRAKGLMSVTSAHPMVKDATVASSDPQGPGHASSDSKDEVSASSDPKAWALTPRTRFPPRPNPRRGLRLLRPQGAGSDSSGPMGRALPRLTPKGRIPSCSAPRARFPPRPFPRGQICYRTKAVALGWDPNRFNHYSVEAHAQEHLSGTS